MASLENHRIHQSDEISSLVEWLEECTLTCDVVTPGISENSTSTSQGTDSSNMQVTL
jgi:hypothetical protein